MQQIKVWKIHECANKYRSFKPADLAFFAGKFQCASLSQNWEAPPVELIGISKPIADFTAWMSMAPVVSERARRAIEDLGEVQVEFLPFYPIDGQNCYVMNILQCVGEEVLDEQASELADFHERFVFVDGFTAKVPPLFKIEGHWEHIFVNKNFADMLVLHKLTGIALANPEEPIMSKILSGSAINVYPGLIC